MDKNSRSFLTETQRAALDAAVASKLSAQAQENRHKLHHQRPKEGSGDRARNNRIAGGPKKGGAGGKYTWGALASGEDGAAAALDRNDPNYDSEDEVIVLQEAAPESNGFTKPQPYKAQMTQIIEEYFNNADVEDVTKSLDDPELQEYTSWFVKTVMRLALDRRSRECEMASMLLSSLYAKAISAEAMQQGFNRLLEELDDLLLDVPSAVELVAFFVARAVVDDILPPSFISKLTVQDGTPLAAVKHKVEVHLAARHAAERLARCWGSAGPTVSHSDAKERIANVLNEFCDSHDEGEVSRCLANLGIPFFHHEVVKQAVYLALDHFNQQLPIAALLAKLAESGEISNAQLLKGMKRVKDGLEDYVLDNPHAIDRFNTFVETAREVRLLDSSYLVLEDSAKSTSEMTSSPHYSHSVKGFKTATKKAVEEYYTSQDADEVALRLEELQEPGLHHMFVQYAITMSLDRKGRERELVSSLLCQLHPKLISTDQMAAGFARLLARLEDTVLDIPDAPHLLGLFLGRAIVDELMPPSILTSLLHSLKDDSLGVTVIQNTGSVLSSRHAAERLQNCWTGGIASLQEIKDQFRLIAKEYAVARDASEAARCLLDLDLPHYHHEFVKIAIELMFEQPDYAAALPTLLSTLSATGSITQTQLRKGFDRVRFALDDYTLDYPKATEVFTNLEKIATENKWLLPDEPVAEPAPVSDTTSTAPPPEEIPAPPSIIAASNGTSNGNGVASAKPEGA